MKKTAVRRVLTIVAYASLVVGLGYSVLALGAKPVHASTCDCTEEQQDANTFCALNFGSTGLIYFDCPVVIDGVDSYSFICSSDPLSQFREAACD